MKYSEKIAHLDTGYKNSQEVAKFLDRKASAIFAAVSAAVTIDIAIAKFLLEMISGFDCVGRVVGLSIFLILGIFLGIFVFNAIQGVFLTLTPRDTGTSKPSCLFPYIPDSTTRGSSESMEQLASAQEKRIDLFEQEVEGEEAIKDYTEQLKQMGKINFHKITHCQKSVSALLRIFSFTAVLAIYSLMIWSVTVF